MLCKDVKISQKKIETNVTIYWNQQFYLYMVNLSPALLLSSVYGNVVSKKSDILMVDFVIVSHTE